jgi:hypothetical protein
MQATLFWDSRLPQINPTSFATHVKEAQSEYFSSLEEAQIALEMLETGLFYALTVKSSPDIPSYSPENEFFRQGNSCFESYMVASSDGKPLSMCFQSGKEITCKQEISNEGSCSHYTISLLFFCWSSIPTQAMKTMMRSL